MNELAKIDFNKEQLDVIKKSLCPGASDMELAFFVEACKSRGLNPIAHQVHYVPRNVFDEDSGKWVKKWTIQTGIGGFRSISEGTNKFAGETEVLWFDKEGTSYKLWTRDDNPFACSAGVLKIIGRDGGKPITQEIRETVYWQAVVQTKKDKTPTRMWLGASGVQQLAKCAKAAAHRAGFGEVLGGVYSHEEMEHVQTLELAEVQTKHEETKGFFESLPEEVKARMIKFGFDNPAKQRVLCNESGNTLEGLAVHLDAREFMESHLEPLKAALKEGGYKNPMEVRRLLVQLGRENWTEEKIKAYLRGEPILELPLEKKP